MKRRWKVLISAGIALAALLAVNTVVVDSETRRAQPTADGAEIIELSSVGLQVLDMPAQTDRFRDQGAPIVLLHGYATSLHWFEHLAPLLNRRHRVISVDLIGHGGSEKPKSGYSIPEQAQAVAEALSGLDVESAVVVGHSMGGYVAVELAEQASELVDRVAVIATPSSDDGSGLPLLARLTYAPVIGEALWRLRLPALVKSAYESAFAPGFDMEAAFSNPDQVVEDNDAMTFSSYEGAGNGADEYLEAETMASRLTRTAVPFLAILGSEDDLVDTELAAADYEAVPGAQVRVFDGVGHSPHLEVPADTAELLLRFAGAAPTPAELARARRQAERREARAARRAARAERRAERREAGSKRRKARAARKRSREG